MVTNNDVSVHAGLDFHKCNHISALLAWLQLSSIMVFLQNGNYWCILGCCALHIWEVLKKKQAFPQIGHPPLLGTPCMASQIESNIRRKVLGWSTKGWIAILGSANWVIHFNSYGHSSQRCALRFTVTLQQHIHCNSYGHSQKRTSLILANHHLGHMCWQLIWGTIT